MAIDQNAIKEHIRGILIALGDDPEREGIKDTPERVARMYAEVFEGMNYTNDEIAEMFSKNFEIPSENDKDMVIVKDMIGLSKIARIADMVAKRLQLQERIGTDIAEVIRKATGSDDVAVYIEGSHSCMTARGIKKTAAKTMTTTFLGRFEQEEALQNKLLLMVK